MKCSPETLQLIGDSVRKAQAGSLYNEVLFYDPDLPVLRNEFLFFIKPEITLPSETIQLDAVLKMICEKLEAFRFNVHRIRLLTADYLKEHNLIDQHYQVIADVSHHGVAAMNTKSKTRFKELYGLEADEANILGGIQFEQRYPFFNDLSLDCLWQNHENLKLAGGTYVEKLKVDLDDVYLLNGFHPRQLLHFNEKGRSLVVFRISGDICWQEARNLFAGTTIPANAAEGSIRRTLFEHKEAFGIPVVTQSYNGVHLSAGPVEAMVELHRFDSDHSDESEVTSFADCSFGKKLLDALGNIPQTIVHNGKLEIDGKRMSVFDLTEDMESEEALKLLSIYSQKNA